MQSWHRSNKGTYLVCLYCGKKIGFRLRSGPASFCSDAHQDLFRRHQWQALRERQRAEQRQRAAIALLGSFRRLVAPLPPAVSTGVPSVTVNPCIPSLAAFAKARRLRVRPSDYFRRYSDLQPADSTADPVWLRHSNAILPRFTSEAAPLECHWFYCASPAGIMPVLGGGNSRQAPLEVSAATHEWQPVFRVRLPAAVPAGTLPALLLQSTITPRFICEAGSATPASRLAWLFQEADIRRPESLPSYALNGLPLGELGIPPEPVPANPPASVVLRPARELVSTYQSRRGTPVANTRVHRRGFSHAGPVTPQLITAALPVLYPRSPVPAFTSTSISIHDFCAGAVGSFRLAQGPFKKLAASQIHQLPFCQSKQVVSWLLAPARPFQGPTLTAPIGAVAAVPQAACLSLELGLVPQAVGFAPLTVTSVLPTLIGIEPAIAAFVHLRLCQALPEAIDIVVPVELPRIAILARIPCIGTIPWLTRFIPISARAAPSSSTTMSAAQIASPPFATHPAAPRQEIAPFAATLPSSKLLGLVSPVPSTPSIVWLPRVSTATCALVLAAKKIGRTESMLLKMPLSDCPLGAPAADLTLVSPKVQQAYPRLAIAPGSMGGCVLPPQPIKVPPTPPSPDTCGFAIQFAESGPPNGPLPAIAQRLGRFGDVAAPQSLPYTLLLELAERLRNPKYLVPSGGLKSWKLSPFFTPRLRVRTEFRPVSFRWRRKSSLWDRPSAWRTGELIRVAGSGGKIPGVEVVCEVF